ncbi:Hcp family type VI secretion system effector [Rahnella bonaserana]|jgi:type VI secretion system secreted protein Hcp
MAVPTLFMKIDNIEGSATDGQYKGWIEIGDVNYGLYCSTAFNEQGSLYGEGVTFELVSFTKKMDIVSVTLGNMVTERTNIGKITIVKTGYSGKKLVQAVKLVYENCMMCNYHFSLNAHDIEAPMESLSFSFGRVSYETNISDGTNKPGKQGPECWDIVKNSKG